MAGTVAYCWASGLIEFGRRVPEGALPIIRGNDAAVRETISAICRHGYDGSLLVPGIPEEPNDAKSLDKLIAFKSWAERSYRARVEEAA